jgi:coenzyme F420 hydrogenase subunit beta
MKIQNVHQVATHRLCIGCGACFYACPENKIKLIDIVDDGIRPIMLEGREAGKLEGRVAGMPVCCQAGKLEGCEDCRLCLEVCPGMKTVLPAGKPTGVIQQLEKRWGNIIELWEGYAADPEIRFKGSSGGLCTALSLFCLENGYAGGILHTGADDQAPWKNKTVLSTDREELVSRTGSRYSPASPCDGLGSIETSDDPCIFVGKPCDVAGLRMTQALRPGLDGNTYLAIGFFCAGTPSTRGTLELLKNHNTDPDEISGFRYRGLGWPGNAAAWRQNDDQPFLEVSYQDSWGFVQKYRPFRCYLCPDLTAEFADISVGDPWYRELGDGDPGRSLILIRTEKGRDIFHRAMEEGYVTADPAEPDIIYRSQKNLLGKRQGIWGRLLAMRLLGIPRPELKGFHLFENWLDLSFKEKVKSILGTARRIVQRNYFKPLDYNK